MKPTHGQALDAICKRQTARFLDHLRDTGQSTTRLEGDFMRVMGFVIGDVKMYVQENSKDQSNEIR